MHHHTKRFQERRLEFATQRKIEVWSMRIKQFFSEKWWGVIGYVLDISSARNQKMGKKS